VLPVYLALGLHLLQTRGKDIVRIKDFRAASKDDIAAVHTMAYVKGLEKVMTRAEDEGIIFLDGTGPTYATPTTYHDSVLAAGAGFALVDSVVFISHFLIHLHWFQQAPMF
jgi:acetoin utilization deacetylase AcuC-like enzyme